MITHTAISFKMLGTPSHVSQVQKQPIQSSRTVDFPAEQATFLAHWPTRGGFRKFKRGPKNLFPQECSLTPYTQHVNILGPPLPPQIHPCQLGKAPDKSHFNPTSKGKLDFRFFCSPDFYYLKHQFFSIPLPQIIVLVLFRIKYSASLHVDQHCSQGWEGKSRKENFQFCD